MIQTTSSTSGTNASDEWRSSLDTYLDCIAGTVPDTTVHSHRSQLLSFHDWVTSGPVDQDTNPEDIVVSFLQSRFPDSETSQATIRGHISTIANFFAYHYERDPAIVTMKLASALRECPDADLVAIGDRISHDSSSKSNSRFQVLIPDLVTALRRRQFGTRTHVYVELLIDTRSRPKQVRQINLSDLDIETGHVRVGIPETHLVSSTGLLTERVVSLSATTLDALETYIEYEREKPDVSDRPPLLTTYSGQVSPSTVRRSVKQMCDARSQESVNPSESVTPNEIWRYAMSKINS